ncbi:hypothetical protein F5Y15DRAFT_359817 [Xylariaceae sp. FL0016]|nr:hypothetical protein F5Y15DRAFT_359817 [Xylariaceae sp. FL0016]
MICTIFCPLPRFFGPSAATLHSQSPKSIHSGTSDPASPALARHGTLHCYPTILSPPLLIRKGTAEGTVGNAGTASPGVAPVRHHHHSSSPGFVLCTYSQLQEGMAGRASNDHLRAQFHQDRPRERAGEVIWHSLRTHSENERDCGRAVKGYSKHIDSHLGEVISRHSRVPVSPRHYTHSIDNNGWDKPKPYHALDLHIHTHRNKSIPAVRKPRERRGLVPKCVMNVSNRKDSAKNKPPNSYAARFTGRTRNDLSVHPEEEEQGRDSGLQRGCLLHTYYIHTFIS